MATKALITVEEYLRTSFDGPDCEFVDGEVVERPMGELPHSTIQTEMIVRLHALARQLQIQVKTEIRIQTRKTRFRVADIAVWRAGDIGSRIPTVAPFLVVEIFSPEDRMVRVQQKVQEYLEMGTEYVWLVDPDERQAIVYSQQTPAGRFEEMLQTHNPDIQIQLSSLFS